MITSDIYNTPLSVLDSYFKPKQSIPLSTYDGQQTKLKLLHELFPIFNGLLYPYTTSNHLYHHTYTHTQKQNQLNQVTVQASSLHVLCRQNPSKTTK
jgi:hypothetical protein